MKSAKKGWEKRIRGMAALFLAIILLFPRQVFAGDAVYPDIPHGNIGEDAFSDLTIVPEELTDVTDRIDAVLAGNAGDKETQLEALYGELMAAYDHQSTQLSLIELAHAKDVTDEVLAQREEDAYRIIYDLYDFAMAAVQKMLRDPAGAFLREVLSDAQIEEAESFEPSSEQEKDRELRKKELTNKYHTAMAGEFTAVHEGEKWTIDDLSEDETLDYETRISLYLEIEKKMNEAVGPIYKELVALCAEEAAEEGYADYAAYAHEEVYERDFSLEDVERLQEAVKRYAVPLSEDYVYAAYYTEADTSVFEDASQSEIIDALEPYIGKVSPALTEAYTYMKENGLADIAEGQGRMDGAFTTDLPQYNAAAIFINAYGSYWDFKTLVHEFGHFNAQFHTGEHALWRNTSLDVAEVQSQGLETLFLPYWSEIARDENAGDYFTYNVLYDMLDAVVTACMYNECETYAFTHPEESLEEWNRAFGGIFKEYGYDYLTDNGVSYQWVEVEHLFMYPFYYISYATSAFAALSVWSEAQSDREAAVSRYLEVSACNDAGFKEMLDKCGLPDIFEESSVYGTCEELYLLLHPGGDEPSFTEACEQYSRDQEYYGKLAGAAGSARKAALTGVIAAGVFFLVRLAIIFIIILVVSARRKKRLAAAGLNRNGRKE